MRDYVNEGGKLLAAGESNRWAEGQDGVYDYNPFAPPECTTPDTYPCLPVFNDFLQYWLGTYTYVDEGGTDADGNPYPVTGTSGAFDGFEGELNAPGSAENQDHTASFLVASASCRRGSSRSSSPPRPPTGSARAGRRTTRTPASGTPTASRTTSPTSGSPAPST